MEQSEPTGEVVRNEGAGRFEMDVGGELALLTYEERDGKLYLLHTEVPEALRGRGLGEQVVKQALEQARAAGTPVVPFCTFVQAYVKRHPEYAEGVESV